jgi:endonuclease/exonuclease/phosphatase family metal-dependent hydrolase
MLRFLLKALTVVNAIGVVTLLVLIVFVSERWWFSAALTFVPRLPLAVPSVVLFAATVRWLPRWSVVNGFSMILGLVFVPGLCAPVDRDPRPENASRVIRVLSCNVQDCQSHPDKLLAEFGRIKPDVLILQEVGRCEPINAYYTSWNIVGMGEYRVISQYPVRLIGRLRTPSVFGTSGRLTATLYEVDHPAGTFQIVNVHCHTARWGLRELRWHSLYSGEGVEEFNLYQRVRETELHGLTEYSEMAADRMPTIFAGDFNTPASSNMFAELRSEYRSAFESAGWGYGYTSPCNTATRWPNNTPWLRIDHILMSKEWSVHSAAIGRTNGSDHRLLWTEVSLKDEERK